MKGALVRPDCVICRARNMEPLHTIKRFPVIMACTDQPRTSDQFMDMKWEICRDCGNVQLKDLVPLEVLYSTNHNDAVGKTWSDHNAAFSKFVMKFSPRRVLEVGGGTGKIAKLTLSSDPKSLETWTILEPNPLVDFTDPKLRLQRAWLGDLQANACEGVDAVVHSHVLEHFYFPNEDLARIRRLVPPGHKMIFSVPKLKDWLKAKFFNALMFEHSYLLDEAGLAHVMARNGYSLTASDAFGNHSQFYCFTQTGQDESERPQNYQENRRIFDDYIQHCSSEGRAIAAKIKGLEDRDEKFLFGAHIFSQVLLRFGLDETDFRGILDNSVAKQGKRLYGHGLFVSPPAVLAECRNPSVVLRAGAYNDEIAAQLRTINPKVTIL